MVAIRPELADHSNDEMRRPRLEYSLAQRTGRQGKTNPLTRRLDTEEKFCEPLAYAQAAPQKNEISPFKQSENLKKGREACWTLPFPSW